jgi:hypothetical protein
MFRPVRPSSGEFVAKIRKAIQNRKNCTKQPLIISYEETAALL